MFALDFFGLAYAELLFNLSNFPSLLPHGFISVADRGKDKALQLSVAESVASSPQAEPAAPSNTNRWAIQNQRVKPSTLESTRPNDCRGSRKSSTNCTLCFIILLGGGSSPCAQPALCCHSPPLPPQHGQCPCEER